MKLEDLTPNASVRGVRPEAPVTVVHVQWHGADALTLTYRLAAGGVAEEILYRDDAARLALAEQGRRWSFDGDGATYRLVAEAHRIRLAHLFDPLLAVHCSQVEPLPHQITAVYEAMLPRQPLRFLLADDPGAGKTIMAGLLMKELIVRGDLKRCLVVCPGNLAEQWQDELHRRFQLPFDILTREKIETARTGNWFQENDLAIARLDVLSRNEDVQALLTAPDCRYDLVVCDEAHKLSATFTGGEIKVTKRYRLGQLLSGITRHFLLMTATPHNGKEEDFQLFLALLDADRFEGRFRDGAHQVDVADLMRRKLQFEGRPLRDLLIEAIRYGDRPDVKARLSQAVSEAVDRPRLQALIEERALAQDAMDSAQVARVREHMERAEVRRLQPHYVESFFLEAFRRLGGTARQRAPRRYEVTHVPAAVRNRNRNRQIRAGDPVLRRYERIAFEKTLLAPDGKPPAAFVCPGHPLLDAVLDLTLERNGDLLQRGTVLVDESDAGTEPRALFTLEHAVGDGERTLSRRMLYVAMDAAGNCRHLHHAPYLDYRPLGDAEPTAADILARPECAWITQDLVAAAERHAIATVVPAHIREVRERRSEWITKTRAAVQERLTKEIAHWDHRASTLKLQEPSAGEREGATPRMKGYAGKPGARLNSAEARRRADDLQERLQQRMAQLDREAQISATPPNVIGALVVVPAGLLAVMAGKSVPSRPADTQASAARARAIVMALEREFGFDPTDREFEKLGYDIESRIPGTGKLRFIEVKGRVAGADSITVTRNEVLTALNKPEDFILAIVRFAEDGSHEVRYVREPFGREPDFGAVSVNYRVEEL